MSEIDLDTTTETMIVELEDLRKSVQLQSMERLASVRMSIVVCESEDVQHMIRRFCKTNETQSTGFLQDCQWRRLCDHVRRMLDQVGVPKIIVDIILKELWPISFEICKWILYHGEVIGIYASSEFFWTPQVNIDYEETAKMLTKNDALDIKKRFKLACCYCLEVKVRSLWQKMSLPEKRSFFVRGNLNKSDMNPIVLYWTYYIQELPIEYWECKKIFPFPLIKYAVENGNLSATKFFLRKLQKPARNYIVLNSFSTYLCKLNKCDRVMNSSHFAILYFLSGEQPEYSIRPYKVKTLILLYFLEWPLQKHFMTVVDRLLPFRENTFGDIIFAIFEKDLGYYKPTYDYKKLFKELWLQSPTKYKRYINTDSGTGSVMFLKFVKKHFGFIFDKNSSHLKAKFRTIIVQRDTSENIAYSEKENVDFFKFLVQERVTTKSSIDSLVHQLFVYVPHQNSNLDTSFYNLPLKELMQLIDNILGII